jgi:hypothetical protein
MSCIYTYSQIERQPKTRHLGDCGSNRQNTAREPRKGENAVSRYDAPRLKRSYGELDTPGDAVRERETLQCQLRDVFEHAGINEFAPYPGRETLFSAPERAALLRWFDTPAGLLISVYDTNPDLLTYPPREMSAFRGRRAGCRPVASVSVAAARGTPGRSAPAVGWRRAS